MFLNYATDRSSQFCIILSLYTHREIVLFSPLFGVLFRAVCVCVCRLPLFPLSSRRRRRDLSQMLLLCVGCCDGNYFRPALLQRTGGRRKITVFLCTACTNSQLKPLYIQMCRNLNLKNLEIYQHSARHKLDKNSDFYWLYSFERKRDISNVDILKKWIIYSWFSCLLKIYRIKKK